MGYYWSVVGWAILLERIIGILCSGLLLECSGLLLEWCVVGYYWSVLW